MPWQADALDVALEVVDGRPAYPYVVVTVPRQSGKTTISRSASLAVCLARADATVWYTAQTRNAARDRWLDASRAIDRSLLGEHTTTRMTNGSEALWWPNGSRWRLFAPMAEALHGETADMIQLDESWAFSHARGTELLQAAIPAGATRPFQLWIISTAGGGESGWLRDWVDLGRSGQSDGLCYIEYGTDSTDPADVIAAHPAIGHTITAEAVLAARDVMTEPEWLRAYGNRWPPGGGQFIPGDLWAACAYDTGPPPPDRPVAIALDVNPERTHASIAAAWIHDGHMCTALAAHGEGLDWVRGALARLTATYETPITYDVRSAAAPIADELARNGARTLRMDTTEIKNAAQTMFDRITENRVRIRPDEALDAAAAAVVPRAIGDAWAWGRRKSAADISALAATSWAVWAADHEHTTPDPLVL